MSINSSQSSPTCKLPLYPETKVPAPVISPSEPTAPKCLNPSKGRGNVSAKRSPVTSCCQASRPTLCWRRCPCNPGGLQTSPAHRDTSQLSQRILFPHSSTSSPHRRDYFSFYLLLMCFAITIQINFSTGCSISPSSISRAHRI